MYAVQAIAFDVRTLETVAFGPIHRVQAIAFDARTLETVAFGPISAVQAIAFCCNTYIRENCLWPVYM